MTTPAPKSPKPLLKFLLPIVAIIAVATGGLYLVKSQLEGKKAQSNMAGPEAAQVGAITPDFPLTTVDGKTEKFSELKGKVILMNFWATWCEACMEEMPSLVALYNLYKDKGFEVVGINLDENAQAVLPKAEKKLRISFPVFSDAENKISDYFDVHAIPFTVVIGPGRKILYVENGERNWNDQSIRHLMDQWLAL